MCFSFKTTVGVNKVIDSKIKAGKCLSSINLKIFAGIKFSGLQEIFIFHRTVDDNIAGIFISLFSLVFFMR